MQYEIKQNDLLTIERLDNNKMHIKSNCMLSCLKCNLQRKSNATITMINVQGLVLPNKPLTNFEIEEAARKLNITNFIGVFMRISYLRNQS